MSSTVPAETPKQSQKPCPQCGSKESWGNAGWCPDCGYYPKFAEFTTTPNPPARPATAADTPTGQARPGVPAWVWVMIAGVVLILGASVAYRVYIYYNGGHRALVALGEIFAGLGLIFGANVAALKQCRKANSRLSVFDAIASPLYLWQNTLEYLPATRKRVWCAAWGITLVVAGHLCVGGFKYSGIWTNDWGFEQPGPRPAAETEQLDTTKENTVSCVIYGYLENDSYECGRILLARNGNRGMQHCAVIHGKDLPEEDYAALERLVAEYQTDEPSIESKFNANWVEPGIQVTLRISGFAPNGELLNSSYKRLRVVTEDEGKAKDREETDTTDDDPMTPAKDTSPQGP